MEHIKNNWKKYLFLLVLAFGVTFFLMWLWKPTGSGASALLIKQGKELYEQQQVLKKENKKLEAENVLLKDKDKSVTQEIAKLGKEKQKLSGQVKEAKQQLAEARKEYGNPPTPLDTLCDNVIAAQDTLIGKQREEIAIRDTLIENKSEQISNLGKQKANLELSAVMYDQRLGLKDDEISFKNKQIRKLKTKTILLGTGVGAGVIGIILSAVLPSVLNK